MLTFSPRHRSKELFRKVRRTDLGFYVTDNLPTDGFVVVFTCYYCLSSAALASFYVTAINVEGKLWLLKDRGERTSYYHITENFQYFGKEGDRLSSQYLYTFAQSSNTLRPGTLLYHCIVEVSLSKKITITHFQTCHHSFYWKRACVAKIWNICIFTAPLLPDMIFVKTFTRPTFWGQQIYAKNA